MAIRFKNVGEEVKAYDKKEFVGKLPQDVVAQYKKNDLREIFTVACRDIRPGYMSQGSSRKLPTEGWHITHVDRTDTRRHVQHADFRGRGPEQIVYNLPRVDYLDFIAANGRPDKVVYAEMLESLEAHRAKYIQEQLKKLPKAGM